MRITTLICALAVAAALFFIVYRFMIEGFQTEEQWKRINKYLDDAKKNKMTTSFGTNFDTICKAFGDGTTGDCAKCLDEDGTNHAGTECGYWAAGRACIPRSGIYRLVPQWLTDKQNMDPSYPQVFDPRDFVYNVGRCGGEACASFTSCKTCASASACGWCDTTNTCMDKSAVTANHNAILSAGSLGSAGSPPQPLCPATRSSDPSFVRITSNSMVTEPSKKSHLELIEEVGTCRPEKCEDKKGCFECTSTSGCGFCKTTGKCIKVDTAGNAGSSGSLSGAAVCATGQITLRTYMCPCSSLSDCKTCAVQPGCGWCVAGKNCVNTGVPSKAGDSQNVIGGVNTRDCAAGADGVATSLSQCTPGAVLKNRRSERGNYKPGLAELNLAQDNTAEADSGLGVDLEGSIGAGVIGSGPVSAAITTPQVSGNGVVTTPGARNPYTITNQPNLFTSPFEEYIKLLIRSQLTESGIPLNEPFQNPVPNITKDVIKSLNAMVRKTF